MHVNTQIRRGVERCIASNEAARLEGMYGVAGLSAVDNFDSLEGLMEETGFAGARDHVKLLRRRCDVVSDNMIRAVPVAKRAMELMEEHDGDLAGIFSKIGKAVKKVAKVAVKLSPSHAIIKKIKPLKKLSPAFRVAEGKTPLIAAAEGPPKPTDPAVLEEAARIKAEQKAAKAKAKADKKAAKLAAKQAKKDAKAAAALARAQVQPGTPAVEAGAQVLANQSGTNFTSEQAAELARQVAANIAQPGSTMPTASMFSPDAPQPDSAAPAGEGGGLLSNPWVLGGGLLAVAGIGYLAMRKRRR